MDLRWKEILLIQHALRKARLKSVECGRPLKFELRRFKEEFDQRLEIIPQGKLAWRKSK